MTSVGKSTFLTILTQIIIFFFGLLSSILISRILLVDGKGLYTLIISYTQLILFLSSLSIENATIYVMGQKKYSLSSVLSSNILIALFLSFFGIFFGAITVFFLHGSFFKDIPANLLLLALTLLPLQLSSAYMTNMLLGLEKVPMYNLILLLRATIYIISIAFALLVVSDNIISALLGEIFANIITMIFLTATVKRLCGGLQLFLSWSYLKDVINFGIKIHIGHISALIGKRINLFLINYFMTPASVGYFSIGVGLTDKLYLISDAIGTIVFQRSSLDNNNMKVHTQTPQILRLLLSFSIPISILLIIFTKDIIVLLYTEAFLPATHPMHILILTSIFSGAWRIISSSLNGHGYPFIVTKISAISSILSIILYLILIPSLGLIGAAYSLLTSEFLSFVCALICYSQLFNVDYRELLVINRKDLLLLKKIIRRKD